MVLPVVGKFKEWLDVFFNNILSQYVENMDADQISYGIASGRIELRDLRIRKGALDKFKLPVDVVEGYLGVFTLNTNWFMFGKDPVQIFIEDVHLLVESSAHTTSSAEEDEERVQRAKIERLYNAELLHLPEDDAGDAFAKQGFIQQMIAKILNNVQVNIKNIHIRYEDSQSVPEHPFAAGITLSEVSAITTDEFWRRATVEGSARMIHKLTTLESLTVYFDTDTTSLKGLPLKQFRKAFSDMIVRDEHLPKHQYVLRPVSGVGKITWNRARKKGLPDYNLDLDFTEIGFGVDSHQYRDVIGLLDVFHLNARHEQYKKFRPTSEELKENKPRALLRFAGRAILDEVHERAKQWTWAHIEERVHMRREYMELYKKKITASLVDETDIENFDRIQRVLPYSHLKIFRALVRQQLKTDYAAKRREDEERERQRKEQQQTTGWVGWLWGSSDTGSSDNNADSLGGMTAQQKKELYEILDYDERAAQVEAIEATSDTELFHVTAKLKRGSLALLSNPEENSKELLSVVFDKPEAVVIKRPENFEASVSLMDFGVFDGVTEGTLYKQIVHVKDGNAKAILDKPIEKMEGSREDEPFFSFKFEYKPLDGRADNALSISMRSMEIIYHRGYVEAVYAFFKPPKSQLQSVEALLSVASQTLEGLRRETRLGLEFALENHKTVDLQLDMHAPIIIIPESVHVADCGVLVLDAGQIAIESKLADKKALREVQEKRHSQYNEEDYERLEALMYDSFSVKLKDAQFVLGVNLDRCRDALQGHNKNSSLHLLERVNIDLTAQNSIVPTARNLTRFKVFGKLPSLHVNFSDSKYKLLMRLIDVAIPHFDGNDAADNHRSDHMAVESERRLQDLRLRTGIFAQEQSDFTIDYDPEDETQQSPSRSESSGEQQLQFQLNFEVEKLRATLSRTSGNEEKVLGQVVLDHFVLAFAMAEYEMKVNVDLRSTTMDLQHEGQELMPIIWTEPEADDDPKLMSVLYTRVQPQHPEFTTTHDSINQAVNIKLSTIVMKADPVDLVSLYDFIMKTFVPAKAVDVSEPPEAPSESLVVTDNQDKGVTAAQNADTIKVSVTLASVRVVLIDGSTSISTLTLPTADISLLLHGGSTKLSARMGNLLLVDDTGSSGEDKAIVSFKGGEFMDLQYESYAPMDVRSDGAQSSVVLRAGSLQAVFWERPLRDTYAYLTKLARLKGLYDAATEAAAQRASEIVKLKFDVSVKSPVLIFPAGVDNTKCTFTMKLGEITANNAFEGNSQLITASLNGLQLNSDTELPDGVSSLKMIDDVSVSADIIQTPPSSNNDAAPDVQVKVTIPDVKIYLVREQYVDLLKLSRAVIRVLDVPTEESDVLSSDSERASLPSNTPSDKSPGEENATVDLLPELKSHTGEQGISAGSRTVLEVAATMSTVRLHLYDSMSTNQAELKGHGVARFSLNNTTLSLKRLVDGAMEVECSIHAFTVSNTRPGQSKFREIIPAARHGRNQLMMLYTVSGGSRPVSMVVANVDSPQVIFSLEPVFAVTDFFMSAFSEEVIPNASAPMQNSEQSTALNVQDADTIGIRLDMRNVSVVILENDADLYSQAVEVSMKQCSFSLQGISALVVEQLRISLLQMNRPSERARLLDDVGLSCTIENRNSFSQRTTSIAASCKEIIFRASYRDINLMMAIINKALSLASNASSRASSDQSESTTKTTATGTNEAYAATHTARAQSNVQSITGGTIVISKEELTASFDGISLVLINDVHETPVLHFETKPFGIDVKDWSSQLRARSTLGIQFNYWNVKNSHWEPLIDPWTLYVKAGQDGPNAALNLEAVSHELLGLNISTHFIEQALTTFSLWNKEKERVLQRARGSYAPYRVQNRTGRSVLLWSRESNIYHAETEALRLDSGKSVDWRFEDWQTERQRVRTTDSKTMSLRFDGSWRELCEIPVDEEGQYTFSLQDTNNEDADTLMFEVILRDNVKVIVLRSTFLVVNKTLYPIEVMVADASGRQVHSVEKIAPEHDYALPIQTSRHCSVRLQPDQGFGYKWSSLIRWDDVLSPRNHGPLTVRCAPHNERESPFRFLVWPELKRDTTYPDATLTLRAPIEIENLLPYDIEYRLFDRDTQHTWTSYLRKGGIMPAHSVELSHMVLLSVTVQDTGLSPSDFAIINGDGRSDFDQEAKLTLVDGHKRGLDLRLNYVRYPNSGGAFKVQIYSPFIIINKIGLPFAVKSVRNVSFSKGTESDLAGEDRPEELSRPKPYLLSHQQQKGHEFLFKVGSSSWSQPVNFEPPSAEIYTVVPSVNGKSEALVGISWTEGSGKYKLSKVVNLAPRFILNNKMGRSIKFRLHKLHQDLNGIVPELAPGEKTSLIYFRPGDERLLTFAYPGLDARWSAPINIEDIGAVHIRMANPGGQRAEDTHLIVADILIEGSTIFINLSHHEGEWPFLIHNDSDYRVIFGQADQSRERPDTQHVSSIEPHTKVAYAWDYPAAKEKKIHIVCEGKRRDVDIMEIGVLPPLKIQHGTRALSLDVKADGTTQLLTISNYREDQSIYKLKRRDTMSSIRDTVSSSRDSVTALSEFEAVEQDFGPTLIVKIEFEGIGISMMNRKLIEVVYFTFGELKIEYTNSPSAQAVTVSCGILQVDNQLQDAYFPVLLQPSPIGRDARNLGALPTLQASVTILNDNAHGVLFIKYASVLLQAITIQIDEAFLYAILDLTDVATDNWDDPSESNILIQQSGEIAEPSQNKGGQDVYFEILELQPLLVSVSFVRNVTASNGDSKRSSTRNPLAVALDILTMTLGNLGDARLQLNALGLKDARLTLPDLQGRIIYHYRQEVLRQLYRVLGSADFLGNPVGLFTNVSSGVADIFYEPWRGVVMHGNRELGIGIAKGAASFLKKTVFGLSDSVTKVTSSIGKGLSAATLDSDFQNRRFLAQRRNKPRHAFVGVAAGAEAFANSVASGVEGVLLKPIEGAETEGALGFFKGVGKGLVGAVTKPVVGVFDLASNVSEGIRNTTTVFDAPQRDRVRKPRVIPFDGVLRPYDRRGALGQYYLKDLDEGAFRGEFYIAHIDFPTSDNIVLLTDKRLISFRSRRLRREWDLTLTVISQIIAEHNGIRFLTKSEGQLERFVQIPEESTLAWFYGEVSSIVRRYNARRKLGSSERSQR